jgi:hypothetical protein
MSAQASPIASTNQFLFALNPTTTLVAGPSWRSFEDFRTAGNAGLESIPEHGVATLRSKAGTFRILRDVDFQALVGLAADVCRLQKGLKLVVQAAKIAGQHPDNDHIQLLIQSASLISESPELPQRRGHVPFDLSSEERHEAIHDDDFDAATATIPRPSW